jgi:hypothetical protein
MRHCSGGLFACRYQQEKQKSYKQSWPIYIPDSPLVRHYASLSQFWTVGQSSTTENGRMPRSKHSPRGNNPLGCLPSRPVPDSSDVHFFLGLLGFWLRTGEASDCAMSTTSARGLVRGIVARIAVNSDTEMRR